MITKEQTALLLKSINQISIPKKHRKNVFWCPKVINGMDGVILYIYGGHALDITFTQRGLMAHFFSKDYCKHFRSESRGETIRNEFINENRYQKGLALLEEWSEERWEEICEAFKTCSTKQKKPDYERMRETRICNDNMCNNDISIFTMEEMIPVDNKNPEMDMVAIRKENEETIISYIEYKCTESATNGAISIPEHYEDMAKLSVDHKNTNRMLQLYYQKQTLLGNNVVRVGEEECRSEIVFLISNVQWNGSVKKELEGQIVSAKTLYDKLEETSERDDFRDEDVKVIILEDIDVESDKSYLLDAKKMMTVNEAMKMIRKKMKEVCE